jgi:multidrug efflux pump subunit AcrA (membrane-fusion protein)
MALCMPFAVQAKDHATPKPNHHTVIESVSSDSITVITGGGESATYKITMETQITYDGEDATASQLQPGMRVTVTPDAADPDTASIITANEPPPSPTPSPSWNSHDNNN